MFQKKQAGQAPQYDSFDTLIGKTTKVEGTVQTEETLRVDGVVQGGVHSRADIVVGEGGTVYGDVNCVNLLLGGKVEGDITTSGQLHITEKGSLCGDANVKTFILEENGTFEGNCRMQNEKGSGENGKRKPNPGAGETEDIKKTDN